MSLSTVAYSPIQANDIAIAENGDVLVSWRRIAKWNLGYGGDTAEYNYTWWSETYYDYSLNLTRFDPDSQTADTIVVADEGSARMDDGFAPDPVDGGFVQGAPSLATDSLGRVGISWMQFDFDLLLPEEEWFSNPAYKIAWYDVDDQQITRHDATADQFDVSTEFEVIGDTWGAYNLPLLSSNGLGEYYLTGVIDDDVHVQKFTLPTPFGWKPGSPGTLLIKDSVSEYDQIILSTRNVDGKDFVVFNDVVTKLSAEDVLAIEIEAGNNDNQIDLTRVTPERFKNLSDNNITVSANAGDDVIVGSAFKGTLYGDAGHDRITSGGGGDNVYGNAGHDILTGSDQADMLDGGKGNDLLYGLAGDDVLRGDDDDDRLFGGDGDDELYGGPANDYLDAGAGLNDYLDGEADNDVYFFGESTVTALIDDFHGDDTIDTSGLSAAVLVDLTSGTLTERFGGTLSVAIESGAVIENVIGTTEDDELIGNAVDNELFGGDGNDDLYGKGGTNLLIGGAGDDVYYLDSLDSTTQVRDFLGTDTIDLTEIAIDDRLAVDLTTDAPAEQLVSTSANAMLVSAGLEGIEYVNGTSSYVQDAPTLNGTWADHSRHGFHGTQQHTDQAGALATWDFTGLTAGEYDVYVTWSPLGTDDPTATTNANFSVAPSGSTPVDFGIDQQLEPANDESYAGRPWQRLANATNDGRFAIDGAGTLSVVLTNNAASGHLIADAVRIVRRKLPPTIDITPVVDSGSQDFSWTVTATDPNSANAPTLDLLPGNHGALQLTDHQNGTGTLFWPEANRPSGTFHVVLRATEHGGAVDALRTERVFVLHIAEADGAANSIPGLVVQHNGSTYSGSEIPLDEGEQLVLNLSLDAVDPDATFFSADFETPLGVTVDGSTLTWTPSADQVGTHSFHVHATDDGSPPLRTSALITVAVSDVNSPPVIEGSLSLKHDTGDAEDNTTADLTIEGTVTNDGSAELVEIEVDYQSDGTYDDVFQVTASEDDETRGTFTIEPSAAAVAGLSNSTITVRAREWKVDPSGSGYHHSQPKTIPNVTVDGDDHGAPVLSADLLHLTGVNDTIYLGTYHPTFAGAVTNDGSVEGIEVLFYNEDRSNTDRTPLYSTVTDAEGTFEFTPPNVASNTNTTYYIAAAERAPLSLPSSGAKLSEVDVRIDFVVQDLVAPHFVGPPPTAANRTSNSNITGSIEAGSEPGALDDLSNVTIEFVQVPYDTNSTGSPPVAGDADFSNVDGIAIPELVTAGGVETYEFVYLPIGLTSQHANSEATYTFARTVVWDDYRKQVVTSDTTLVSAFIYDTSATSNPVVESFGLKHFDDANPALPLSDPTVEGRVTVDTAGQGGVVVEFSLGDADFSSPDGFAVTDADGRFEFTPLDLEPGVEYTLYARAAQYRAEHSDTLVSDSTVSETFTLAADPIADAAILDFALKYNTGDAGNDTTNLPTVHGTVQYAGDMDDVVVEFNLGYDGEVDAMLTPGQDGYFEFTPEGLVVDAPEEIEIRARVRVPDYSAPTLDFSNPLFNDDDDNPDDHPWIAEYEWDEENDTYAWTNTDSDGNRVADFVDAWFSDLFANDGVTLQGDWYNSDIGRNWDDLFADHTSEWQAATPFFLVDDEDDIPTLTTESPAGLPIIAGTIGDDGPTSELHLEFFINGSNVADGTATTDDEGNFAYAVQNYDPATANTVTIRVHQPQYVGTTTADVVAPSFTVVADADLAVDEFSLAQVVGTSATGDGRPVAIVPEVAGSITSANGVALATVQFSWNHDGSPDASTLADGLGEFSYTPAGPLPDQSDPTFAARVAEDRTHVLDFTGTDLEDSALDGTEVTYVSLSDWNTFTWEVDANDAPVIERFELAVDTGSKSVADRVTSDPTVVGLVTNDNGAAYLTVEFDHDNDGAVDGTAVTDADGYFRYTPHGLSEGRWNIRARVRELDGVTGNEHNTNNWVSIAADGDPTSLDHDGPFEGFNLIAPPVPTVSTLQLGSSDQRITGQIVDPNAPSGVEQAFGPGVTVKFSADGVEFGSTTVESDGSFEYLPTGLAFSSDTGTFTLTATAEAYNYLTDLPVVGPPKSEAGQSFIEYGSRQSGLVSLGSFSKPDDAPIAAPSLVATINVPTQFVGSVSFERAVPVVAEIATGSASAPSFVTTVGVTKTDAGYEFEFTPSEYGFTDTDTNFLARVVAVDDSDYYFTDWNAPIANPAVAEVNLTAEPSDETGTALQPTLSGIISPENFPADSTTLYEVQFDFDLDEVVDESVYLDEAVTSYTYDFTDLEPGAIEFHARVIATVTLADESVELVEGEWESFSFDFVSPAPTLSTLSLVDGNQNVPADPSSTATLGSSETPVIVGNADAVQTQLDTSRAGMTVEFDHNFDGVVDGTAVVLSDGSFAYEIDDAVLGAVTLQARAVDSLSDTRPLVGEWVAMSFELLPKVPPVVNDIHLIASEGGHQLDATTTIDVSSQPVIEGTVDLRDYVGQATIEFRHADTGQVVGAASLDVHGQFSIRPQDLPYGVNTLATRVVVQTATGRVEGTWSNDDDPTDVFSFFHNSAVPAVVNQFVVEDATRAIVAGRATSAGFGVRARVIISIDGTSQDDEKGSVWTDADGYFRYEIPRLAAPGGNPTSYDVFARADIADPNANAFISGQPTPATPLSYAPALVSTPTADLFDLAYNTGDPNDVNVTADPTLTGTVDRSAAAVVHGIRYGRRRHTGRRSAGA